MLIKVCGMREPENVQQVAALAPDFLGFIFYQGSKRFAGAAADLHFVQELPATTKKVGVFVNEQTNTIKSLITELQLNLVQLHGNETPAQCAELQQAGVEVVKAFSVDENSKFEVLDLYEKSCDYFLFDTKGTQYGGNGITFDWRMLEHYHLNKPYFLSGGLNLENISHIKDISKKPFALDVNSGFELQPGLKDVEKLRQLFKEFKN
ncbi:phosphoribosylanthranilate isomerase [Pontibacter sp. 13R65]|uniref:phosphoribosylanthranilate isomerase n=1 Tax=Pontibacter sp. 13R65 TaxID=3127458 RepID=UPI00301B995E